MVQATLEQSRSDGIQTADSRFDLSLPIWNVTERGSIETVRAHYAQFGR